MREADNACSLSLSLTTCEVPVFSTLRRHRRALHDTVIFLKLCQLCFRVRLPWGVCVQRLLVLFVRDSEKMLKNMEVQADTYGGSRAS